jgi:UDP-2-acetamido-2-deoxy-ribo-hexuluronate aminotransferase
VMQFIDLKAQQALIRADLDRRIAAVLDHGQYILGPEIAEMERALADYVRTAHCVSVSSGTDALSIAFMALGIEAGDEVITTPFSFIATAETIALLGARPVFVDVDPRTYNLDPALLEAAITPRTKAIVPVGLYGQCADMDAIDAVAARHGLPVVEDAAQSFGATYRGRRSCALSTVGCTSFFPSKPLGCYGDGGACFTDDAAIATRMAEIRNHGQDRRYHHPILGLNGRMDTLQAAVVLAKLPIFDGEVAARSRIGARYSALLADANCVTPWIAPGNTSVYAQYTIQVSDREAVVKALHEAGIPTAVHYPVTLDRQPAMAKWVAGGAHCPVSHRLAGQVVSLPMHPYLTEEGLRVIAAAVTAATARLPPVTRPA